MAIRTLTAADVAPAAQVLAEAFSLDPLYGWLLPGAADRVDELARMMAGLEGTDAARAHAAELLAEASRG